MKCSGAKLAAKALVDANIELVLGIPGTHNIELYDAMREEPHLRPLLVGSEQSASFIADGYARASGRLACVNVVPGAGVTHALSGVAEAYMDQIPMLVLATGIRSDSGAHFQLHDIDQCAILRPVCKGVFRALSHRDIYTVIRKAADLALSYPRGPVAVEIPANLLLFPGEVSDQDLVHHPISSTSLSPEDERALDEIAECLKSSSKTCLYLGLGCLPAAKHLAQLAERLQAPVFTTISAKGLFPETHPLFAWNVPGEGAPPQLKDLFNEAEVILAIGCRFGEVATASYGIGISGKLIHIDIDPHSLNANYPAHLSLAIDSQLALPYLLQKLSPSIESNYLAEEKISRFRQDLSDERRRLPIQADQVTPAHFFLALNESFSSHAAFITDSGNGTFLAMEHLHLSHPQRFMAPVDFSCMGYSVPAAIGAALARPDQPAIGLVGDGAFLMTGLEMLTATREGLPVAFFILRDRELSQIAQFQRRVLNRTTLTELHSMDFKAYSQSLGLEYFHIDQDAQIQEILGDVRTHLGNKVPTLTEVNIDYSRETFFTQGALKTNFDRLDIKSKIRMAGRLVGRKIFSRD